MKKISVTLPNSAKKATFKVRNSVKTKIKKKKSGDGFSNLENKVL